MIKKPELLAPAGDLEKLKIAITYGADAVFIGGQKFSLRANASNFTIDEIEEGVIFACKHDARIYVTMNIYGHEFDFSDLESYLIDLERVGVFGIIAADPAIITTAKRVAPNLEIHLSTQQSVANVDAAKFWQSQGLERLVLARELTNAEISTIIDAVDCEFEVFVHGAMCIAYSGRCTLSNHMTTRDSNRGGCCQSCRWEYDLQNESQSLLDENEDKFAMSPKDLNLLKSIPKMIEIGVDSLKIEGRMKSIHYVATVVSVYRKIIDAYMESPSTFVFDQSFEVELNKCANRDTAPAFFEGVPTHHEQMYNNRDEHPTKEFIGIIRDFDDTSMMAIVEQRNYFKVGDTVEIFSPRENNFTITLSQILDENDNHIEICRHPKQIVKIPMPVKVQKNSLLRMVTIC